MLKKIKKNLDKAKNGCCCVFVPVSKTRGLKLYHSKEERDYALRTQKRANKWDIGPKTFNAFSVKYDYPLYVNEDVSLGRYGYVTQIASKINNLTEKEYRTLHAKMEKHNFTTVDVLPYHNVGKIGRRVVCIDFDKGSMCEA